MPILPHYHTVLCLPQMEPVDALHCQEISLVRNTLVVTRGTEAVVRYARDSFATIEDIDRFQVQPFPEGGFGLPRRGRSVRDSGYLQCKLAAEVKLPSVALPVTWLLE